MDTATKKMIITKKTEKEKKDRTFAWSLLRSNLLYFLIKRFDNLKRFFVTNFTENGVQ